MNDDIFAPRLPTIIHQVVTEWLGDPIECKNLAKAYDALIGCCNIKCSLDILDDKSSTLPILCDLYRALLVTSFLLRLNYPHSSETCHCLENSVERCLWLLQILVAAPTSQDLVGRLPPSSYPLLAALLEEPLIPLHRNERNELWWSLSSYDDDEDEDNCIEGIPDKKQLAIEEQQLLDMARRPIPERTNDQEDNTAEFHAEYRKDPLLLPSDILVEDNGYKLHRCGVLHVDDRTLVLTSQTTFDADNGVIHLKIDEDSHIRLQISTSRSLIWAASLQTAIREKTVQETLRNQTPALWN